MDHSDGSIDISPKALMKVIWALPQVDGWVVDAVDKDSHAKGLRLIKQMIEAGADQSRAVRFGHEPSASTPIMIAAANDDAICLSLLLSLPLANPGFVDHEGDCALTMAARYGCSSCVAMLAPLCDPNIKDSLGRTALACAMQNGHSASVAILAPITDLSARNDKYETARQFAERHQAARQYIPLLDSIIDQQILASAIGGGNVGPAEHIGRRRSL